VGNFLVDNLIAGMTLRSDVTDMSGGLLMRSGTVISEVIIRVLQIRGVKEVDAHGLEEKDSETSDTAQSVTPIVNEVEIIAENHSALANGAAIENEISKEDENKIKIMRAILFFKPFTDQELYLLLKTGVWVKCNTGDIIFKEGETAERSFFVILKGSICIQKRVGVTNMKKTLHCLKQGDCLGEMALITGGYRSADAVAEGETYLMKINVGTLNKNTVSFDLRSIQFKLYRAFCQILAQRLANASTMAVKLY
jgi:CRP-like cAMP-binding protein